MSHSEHDIDALAHALYNLSALRRDLQRFAGIEHAVGGLMVLSVVHRIGPARISDVAAEMQVNLSVASRQITTLEDEGFVDRVADPHDGRSSLIAISEDGRAKLGNAHRRLVDSIATAVDDWERDEVVGLADGIVRLRDALGTCDSHEHPNGHGKHHGTGTPVRGATVAPASPLTQADRSAAARPTTSGRPAADPTLTPAKTAGARHEEHIR